MLKAFFNFIKEFFELLLNNSKSNDSKESIDKPKLDKNKILVNETNISYDKKLLPTLKRENSDLRFFKEISRFPKFDNNLALANVMAHIESESKFEPVEENLNYSANTIMKLFPHKVGYDKAEAIRVANSGPEAVGNIIYGNRMGNSGKEGYKYRGRGFIQLTGKHNYEAASDGLGYNFVFNPDLLLEYDIAVEIVNWYLTKFRSLSKDELLNSYRISKAIGHHGYNGAEANRRAERSKYFLHKIESGYFKSQDKYIKLLRKTLGLRPNPSMFDEAVYVRVKRFQSENNLVSDGIVGPKTWNKLLSQ